MLHNGQGPSCGFFMDPNGPIDFLPSCHSSHDLNATHRCYLISGGRTKTARPLSSSSYDGSIPRRALLSLTGRNIDLTGGDLVKRRSIRAINRQVYFLQWISGGLSLVVGVRVCCLHDVRCINVNAVAMLLAPMVCRHVRFQSGIANKDLGGRNSGNLLYFLTV